MRTSTFVKATVSIGVVAAIAPVAPAAAQNGAAPTQARAATERTHSDPIVIRRDGDRAVPFDPNPIPDAPVSRRDGSIAEPLLTQAADDGFHWGDAAIGAAGAYMLIMLGSGAVVLIRRRRPPRRLAQRPA